jgi:flagellin
MKGGDGVRVNIDTNCLLATRYYTFASKVRDKAIQNLSTGHRVNTAGDDPAGLAVSEIFRSLIKGTGRAMKNVQDAVLFLDVAEAALTEVSSALQRLRVLAIAAANSTYAPSDREVMQLEVEKVLGHIDYICSAANYNTIRPLVPEDGKEEKEYVIQADARAGETITIKIEAINTEILSIKDLSVKKRKDAEEAIVKVDGAIEHVGRVRAHIGAERNRALHALENLGVKFERESFSESQIRDADYAWEMINLTKGLILSQTSTSLFAQANFARQYTIQLLP